MTNGDKIRAMDNYNLACMLAGYFITHGELKRYVPMPDACGENCAPYDYEGECESCPVTIERWLDAEVEA